MQITAVNHLCGVQNLLLNAICVEILVIVVLAFIHNIEYRCNGMEFIKLQLKGIYWDLANVFLTFDFSVSKVSE